MFHDEVELFLTSGKGGDGAVSFRREKFIPKGGPDGGDGGKGGDVYIESTRQLSDLNDYAPERELHAENGMPGAGRRMTGRNGSDLILSVPIGTQVYRKHNTTWQLVFDFAKDGIRKKLLTGGAGGLGNVHFATATHQTPREAQPGESGIRAEFKFELRLIADVGIIGLPNSGKSTFLSIISEAKPKIGNYPFTTLSPVLGVVTFHDHHLIFADIPGLIEGASQGKGLGHQFLRHIQRTRVLIHFIDALARSYKQDYSDVIHELEQFDPSLLKKPQLVAISKSELIHDKKEFEQKIKDLCDVIQPPATLFSQKSFSAVTKENIEALLQEVTHYFIEKT